MAPGRSPSPIFRREQRCQTCCQCGSKLALACMGNRCPYCHRDYCGDCVVDTIELYEIGVTSKGVVVIGEPAGPSKNTLYLLECERERRLEEGWPASNRGDDEGRGTPEAESDFEEIIEKITPAMKRASRKAPTNIEDLDAGKAKTPKRKTPVLDSPSANSFEEHEDGKYPQNRPMTSELLTPAELSLLSDEHGRPANKNKSIPEKRAAVGAPGPRKAPMNKVHGRSNKRRASS